MTMSSSALSELESQVGLLLKNATATLSNSWQSSKTVTFKEHVDPVTEFDVRIENELRTDLAMLLPEAGFIVEEGETNESDGLNWVIDPIDQTKNFVGRIPLFYTQIALVEEGVPILGVIYNPISDQMFSASRGNGAKLNRKHLVSNWKTNLADALIDIDFGGTQDIAWKTSAFRLLVEAAFRVRVTGGAYAPYLLTGGIDAFIVLNAKTKPVDQLPRLILAREAGLTFDTYTIDGRAVLAAGQSSVVAQAIEAIRGATAKIKP